MPTSDEFARGFGLKKGLQFGHFQLNSFHADEKSIVRFNEYQYPITMVFSSSNKELSEVKESDAKHLLDVVAERFATYSKIIRTAKNRPYKCQFQDPVKGQPTFEIRRYNSDNNSEGAHTTEEVVLHFTCHARRVKEADAKEMEEGEGNSSGSE